MAMDKKLKKKWVAALRSGKYLQVQDVLRAPVSHNDAVMANGFCCLGVLCDVIDPKGWIQTDERNDATWKIDGMLQANSGCLTNAFQEKVGLPRGLHNKLITMNDNKDSSFTEIAAVI